MTREGNRIEVLLLVLRSSHQYATDAFVRCRSESPAVYRAT